MTKDELLIQTHRLIEAARHTSMIRGTFPQICQFLRSYGGPNNEFYDYALKYDPRSLSSDFASAHLVRILQSFYDYVSQDLLKGMSPKRQAEIDVVSDFLSMAEELLEKNDVHPAAPAVLIGATLEEFLRTWIDDQSIDLEGKKPSLETYSQVLRKADFITKQDGKDITSWSGVRNHAAHGEWDKVDDRGRIRLMLEGVNLFMRKYSAS